MNRNTRIMRLQSLTILNLARVTIASVTFVTRTCIAAWVINTVRVRAADIRIIRNQLAFVDIQTSKSDVTFVTVLFLVSSDAVASPVICWIYAVAVWRIT